MYTHRFSGETTYQVVEYYNGGSRIISHDQHDYLTWCETNTPTIEAAGRFLSVVDGVLVVDPNKTSILAAEEAARLAEIARQEARAQDIVDNLPSWAEIETAITNATTIAALKVIVKKLARVVYWLAKNTAY